MLWGGPALFPGYRVPVYLVARNGCALRRISGTAVERAVREADGRVIVELSEFRYPRPGNGVYYPSLRQPHDNVLDACPAVIALLGLSTHDLWTNRPAVRVGLGGIDAVPEPPTGKEILHVKGGKSHPGRHGRPSVYSSSLWPGRSANRSCLHDPIECEHDYRTDKLGLGRNQLAKGYERRRPVLERSSTGVVLVPEIVVIASTAVAAPVGAMVTDGPRRRACSVVALSP